MCLSVFRTLISITTSSCILFCFMLTSAFVAQIFTFIVVLTCLALVIVIVISILATLAFLALRGAITVPTFITIAALTPLFLIAAGAMPMECVN